jgi:type I restriction enzyme R subunit
VVKFNQMIGRGTRLCPDLFAMGDDKDCFYVFDLCSNFEYFGQDLATDDPKLPDTLMARLVKARVAVARRLAHVDPEDATAAALRKDVLDHLHQHAATMTTDNFLVRRERPVVEKWSVRERWEVLTDEDIEEVAEKLAPLPNGLAPENAEAKQFDVLCYQLIIATADSAKAFTTYRDRVRELASRLSELATIPHVAQQLAFITAVAEEEYWTDITLPMIDEVRRKLRNLIQFIERQARPVIYTDLMDDFDPSMVVSDVAVPVWQTGFSAVQYRKKVEKLVRDNEHHVSVAKLKRNQPLTQMDLEALEAMLFNDEVGSREQFALAYPEQGEKLNLPLFIRSLVGLSRAEAKAAFGKYLASERFTANQVRFIETIVDFLTNNGVMNPGLLYAPPFTDTDPNGLDGVFSDNEADNIVAIVRGFNKTVGAEFAAAM